MLKEIQFIVAFAIFDEHAFFDVAVVYFLNSLHCPYTANNVNYKNVNLAKKYTNIHLNIFLGIS